MHLFETKIYLGFQNQNSFMFDNCNRVAASCLNFLKFQRSNLESTFSVTPDLNCLWALSPPWWPRRKSWRMEHQPGKLIRVFWGLALATAGTQTLCLQRPFLVSSQASSWKISTSALRAAVSPKDNWTKVQWVTTGDVLLDFQKGSILVWTLYQSFKEKQAEEV